MPVNNERLSVRIAFEGGGDGGGDKSPVTSAINDEDERRNVSIPVSLFSLVFHSRVARSVLEMGGADEQQHLPSEVTSLLTALLGGENLAADLLEDAVVSGKAIGSAPRLSTADRSSDVIDTHTGVEVSFAVSRWETLLCTAKLSSTDKNKTDRRKDTHSTLTDTTTPLLTVVPGPFSGYDPTVAASDLYEYLSRFEATWLQFTNSVAEAQAARKHALMAHIGHAGRASTEHNTDSNPSSFQSKWLGRMVPKLNAIDEVTPKAAPSFPDPLYIDPVDIQLAKTNATTSSSVEVSDVDLDFKMPFRAEGYVVTAHIPRPLASSSRLANIILPWERLFLDTLYDCSDAHTTISATSVGTEIACSGSTSPRTTSVYPTSMRRLLQLVHVASFLQADYLKTLLLAKISEILLLDGTDAT